MNQRVPNKKISLMGTEFQTSSNIVSFNFLCLAAQVSFCGVILLEEAQICPDCLKPKFVQIVL